MLSSSQQKVITCKAFHQESTIVNHWRNINYAVNKTLATFLFIHRKCYVINITPLHNNIYRQSRKPVLHSIKWFTSVMPGVNPNKLFKRDLRYAAAA